MFPKYGRMISVCIIAVFCDRI